MLCYVMVGGQEQMIHDRELESRQRLASYDVFIHGQP